jgi:hypothetical protein
MIKEVCVINSTPVQQWNSRHRRRPGRVITALTERTTRVYLQLREDGIGDLLACPGCGGEYTHAAPAAERYDSRPPEERWSWRIPMSCESGCTFELIIEQHKGSTYLRTDPQRRLS